MQTDTKPGFNKPMTFSQQDKSTTDNFIFFFFVADRLRPGSSGVANVRLDDWILCSRVLLYWDGVHLYRWHRTNQRQAGLFWSCFSFCWWWVQEFVCFFLKKKKNGRNVLPSFISWFCRNLSTQVCQILLPTAYTSTELPEQLLLPIYQRDNYGMAFFSYRKILIKTVFYY